MNLKSLLVPLGIASLPFVLSQCSDSGDSEAQDPNTVGTPSTTGSTTGSAAATTGTPTTTGAAVTSAAANSSSSSSSANGASSSSSANGASSSSSSSGASNTAASTSTTTSTSTADTSTGTGGGTSTSSSGAGGTTGAGGTSGGGDFTLTSSELEEGAEFMPKHTCAMSGFDMDESPPFAWTGAPSAAMSFALVLLDTTLTDEGDMNGYHWAMWDIPASVSELPGNLPTGASITSPVSAKQYNPLSASYLGPCPSLGGGAGDPHTYVFTLYAMPEAETASLAGLNNVKQIEAAIKAVAIGSASLSGTSNASPP